MRIDVALVRAGLFESRAKAQEALAAGLVTADGALVTKAATPIGADATLAAQPAYPWVSRGGVKLAAALETFGFDPRGLVCLDVGASTGGFSHVLLARGAAQVTAVDVGHGQLHAALTSEPRLRSLEGRDARTLRAEDLGTAPSLVVIDVSFIALGRVLPPLLPLAAKAAMLVALVKPQFEAGRAAVRKGIVRDPAHHAAACEGVVRTVLELGWTVVGVRPSPIEGQDGNREFLLGARR